MPPGGIEPLSPSVQHLEGTLLDGDRHGPQRLNFKGGWVGKTAGTMRRYKGRTDMHSQMVFLSVKLKLPSNVSRHTETGPGNNNNICQTVSDGDEKERKKEKFNLWGMPLGGIEPPPPINVSLKSHEMPQKEWNGCHVNRATVGVEHFVSSLYTCGLLTRRERVLGSLESRENLVKVGKYNGITKNMVLSPPRRREESNLRLRRLHFFHKELLLDGDHHAPRRLTFKGGWVDELA
ncbi:hypothetical protein B0H13DRAFT_1916625 [Mycena leptocephala]|nr:hypothetical protein B0H13DRAFT_1916625 [Mycena leptocephala]